MLPCVREEYLEVPVWKICDGLLRRISAGVEDEDPFFFFFFKRCKRGRFRGRCEVLLKRNGSSGLLSGFLVVLRMDKGGGVG